MLLLQTVTEGETLVVPHPRWQERDFVKAPLADLCGGSAGSSSEGAARRQAGVAAAQAADGASGSSEDEAEEELPLSIGTSSSSSSRAGSNSGGGGLHRQLRLAARLWQEAGGERQLGTPDLECVLPMGRLGLWPYQRRTQVGSSQVVRQWPALLAMAPHLMLG